jgi:O-acetylserine/cysteine efflux transporter
MTYRDIFLAILVPICWGLGFTMAKPAIEHFPPLFTMLVAYGINAALISAIWRTPQKTPHLHVALITAFVVTIQGALIFYGYQHVSASVCTLVIQIQVPAAVLFGWLLLKEELSLRKMFGITLAIAGVVIVVGLPKETPPLVPLAMIIAGACAWSFGQVLSRKFSRDGGLVMLRAISLHAVPQLVITGLLLESGQMEAMLTATLFQWLAFGIFAVIGFFVAYSLWYTLLSRNRIDEVMPFVLLMPIIGVLSAALVLGEPVTFANLAGGAVILTGVAIVSGLRLPKFSRSPLKPAAD